MNCPHRARRGSLPRSVAEAKRFGLTYGEVSVHDGETARFRSVLRLYEELKGEAWDYDDFRLEPST